MVKAKERVGIYGGAFSPIHMGHVRAAYAFLNEMRLDKLIIVPSERPPHKKDMPGATDGDRLNMARLAFEGSGEYRVGRIEISDFELKLNTQSYTACTLEHFASPGRILYFLVGTDVFLKLSRWYRAEDIFRLADIVLMRREDEDGMLRLIKEKSAEYIREYGAKVHVLDLPSTVISSSDVRVRLSAGLPTEGLLPSPVEEYIKNNNLYRN